MKCYACEKDATHECRRCGRLYCDDHGDELCAECLRPASALPSYTLYRGSLLALLVGTGVALWLLLKPPEEASQSVPSIIAPTATPTVSVKTLSPTMPAMATLTAEATVVGTPGATPAATATAAEPDVIEYTVEAGDSLFSIAQQFLPADEALGDFARRIAERNGLSLEDPLLQPGQTLLIPR